MVIRLHDKWVWDFWFAQEGPDYHIFYLQALRSLREESRRHWNVSVGHAVSQDLSHWEILPDVLKPSHKTGTWDNYTTWTGSIIKHEGLWHMLYTGTNREENGKIQRIGLAVSPDLMTWARYSEQAVIIANAQWYETDENYDWHEVTWRDPWVFKIGETFHAFITARYNVGPRSARGVIGHAISSDLVSWEVKPPITKPGGFGFMEVPQLVEIHGLWYLFFSVTKEMIALDHLENSAIKKHTGTHYLVADHPLGPFRYLTHDFLVGDEMGSLYAGKVIRGTQDEWVFLAFEHFSAGKMFVGKITDPFPLSVQKDGKLFVPHRSA
jgi:beta-fructofuranosidase